MVVGPCGPQFEKSSENTSLQHSLRSFLKSGEIPTETWDPPDARYQAPWVEVVVEGVEWRQRQDFIGMERAMGMVISWLGCDFQ